MVLVWWLYMVSCEAGICYERPGVPMCTDVLEDATGIDDEQRPGVPLCTVVQKDGDTKDSKYVRPGVPKCTDVQKDGTGQEVVSSPALFDDKSAQVQFARCIQYDRL